MPPGQKSGKENHLLRRKIEVHVVLQDHGAVCLSQQRVLEFYPGDPASTDVSVRVLRPLHRCHSNVTWCL